MTNAVLPAQFNAYNAALGLERLDIPVLEAKMLVTQSNIQYYIFYST